MKQRVNLIFILLIFLPLSQIVAQEEEQNILKYTMTTRWADDIDPENVLPEYPRPQMVRNEWTNLNGYWEYAIKPVDEEQPRDYEGKILVPFPVESELSGVKRLVGEDNYLWYKKEFEVPEGLEEDKRLLLHFGAVDWETTIYINGEEVGSHKGGYDPFTFDISDYLKEEGSQEIVVRVWDPTDKGMQARGKQVSKPGGIWYSPVTGIWQTVWLETVPENYFQLLKITPDIDQRLARFNIALSPLTTSGTIEIKAIANGEEVGSEVMPIGIKSERAKMEVKIPEPILWSPDNPFLYDLVITLKDNQGRIIDRVESYLGMRKVSLGKDANGYTRIMLNNKPLFQFGLLDQGWWPGGLYTPPTDEAMVYDIKITKKLGFNMLRKHVKVEPARFYYHCDKMGMLVWQDMPSGFIRSEREQHVKHDAKIDWERPKASAVQFEKEMKSMIDHLYSFPSILVWVPLNEGWGQYDTERLAKWVKKYDPSRLVDAPSGWADREVGDMIDVHLYPGPGMELPEEDRASVLGEFGGIGWPVEDHLWWDKRNWGYRTYQDRETYRKRFRAVIENLQGLISWGLSAAIYTQTTDVEGEVNGVMTYDREVLKLDPEETRKIIAPLYEPWWEKRILVADSEHEAHKWQVKFKDPDEQWPSPSYDDYEWSTEVAPFSASENYFLPPSTKWKTNELYARKSFYLDVVPEKIFVKYYAPKTEVKLYLNGNLVEVLKEGGGRKRHYTHVLLKEAPQFLKPGKNVLAVEATSTNNVHAFDMGLYTSGVVNAKD